MINNDKWTSLERSSPPQQPAGPPDAADALLPLHVAPRRPQLLQHEHGILAQHSYLRSVLRPNMERVDGAY